MNKIINFLAIVLLLVFTVELQAQRSGDDDDGGFDATDRLWFGTGVDGLGITSNSFNFGLSPIVGYKFTKNLSAGIRIPVNYSYLKLQVNTGANINDNKIDWGLGAFARAKLFFGVFFHGEYNERFLQERVTINGFYQLDPDDPSKLWKENINRDELNIGLGYSNDSNGGFGYEISVLYNTIEDDDSIYNPWTIRVGFNYNF